MTATTIDRPENAVPVLNAGFVSCVQHLADDLMVANAARVSFAKMSERVCPVCKETEDGCDSMCNGRDGDHGPMILSDADSGLIGYLGSGKHGTPFEHNLFTFFVKAPIFVVREWFRHRIGWSYNEWSARYSKMEPEWYIPANDYFRTQVGKPGAYTFEPMDDPGVVHAARKAIHLQNQAAYDLYESLLEKGVAKEIARTHLPVGMYTQFYATCNARSLMNFLALRNSPHAQREIREYATVMEDIFKTIMPRTHEVFIQSERVAP